MSEEKQQQEAPDKAMKLWNAVSKTDPKFTKPFKKAGGFGGTAINIMHTIMEATKQWGPFGGKWGARVVSESIVDGVPYMNNEGRVLCQGKLHVLLLELRFPSGAGEGHVQQFGGTVLVGQDSRGFYADEDAPKKSFTDALAKCLSYLGFGADIYLGYFADSKYIQELNSEFSGNGQQNGNQQKTGNAPAQGKPAQQNGQQNGNAPTNGNGQGQKKPPANEAPITSKQAQEFAQLIVRKGKSIDAVLARISSSTMANRQIRALTEVPAKFYHLAAAGLANLPDAQSQDNGDQGDVNEEATV